MTYHLGPDPGRVAHSMIYPRVPGQARNGKNRKSRITIRIFLSHIPLLKTNHLLEKFNTLKLLINKMTIFCFKKIHSLEKVLVCD